MINRFKILLAALIILSGCSLKENSNIMGDSSNDSAHESNTVTFAKLVQSAHSKDSFLKKETIQFNLKLFFGGNERLNGKISLSTDGTMGKYEMLDGSELIFRHDSVFISENYPKPESARFAAYTWSYFFLMPYKLDDPGTIWSAYEDTLLNGKTFKTAKLNFEAGTGDAPDDWYIVYADPNSMLMNTAAYIVTAGKSKDEAEKDPHAIQYSEYADIHGIPIAQRWDFYAWRADSGLTDTLGYAILENIKFDSHDESKFNQDESVRFILE